MLQHGMVSSRIYWHVRRCPLRWPALSGGVQRCPAVSGGVQRCPAVSQKWNYRDLWNWKSHKKRHLHQICPAAVGLEGGCWGRLLGGVGVAGGCGAVGAGDTAAGVGLLIRMLRWHRVGGYYFDADKSRRAGCWRRCLYDAVKEVYSKDVLKCWRSWCCRNECCWGSATEVDSGAQMQMKKVLYKDMFK